MAVFNPNSSISLPVFAGGGRLHDVVDAYCHVDIADAAFARARRIKVLPTTSPLLIVHYRAPMASPRGRYKRTVNGMHSHVAELQPSGPLGVVLVRLRAEAADRLLGVTPAELRETSIDLANIFGAHAMSLLEEQLAEADGPAARIGRMRDFLERRSGPQRLDRVVEEAIRVIRRNPAIAMARLADHLGIGERSLQRRFKSGTGASAKQFARIERMQRAVARRRGGADWADVAHAAGFTDQAHLIRDFRALAGVSPDAFCRAGGVGAAQPWNAKLAASDFYNTFVA